MGRHWVKAKVGLTRYDITGAYKAYQPGDWFEVRNQEMLELLAKRQVVTTAQVIKAEFKAKDAGVLLVGDAAAPYDMDVFNVEVIKADVIKMPWSITAILSNGARTTATSIVLGMMRVDSEDDYPAWEMAAQLISFSQLARDVGTPADKDRTLELIGSLLVPVYNPSVVWVRRTKATERVLKLWNEELALGADPQHAFLRAVYCQSVKLCTLPDKWIGEWVRA